MKYKRTILLLLLPVFILAAGQGAYGFQNIHHKSGQARVNYDSLYENAVPLSDSKEGHEILQYCIKMYGGRAKLQELNSIQLKYHMNSAYKEDSLFVTKYWQKDKKYKIYRTNASTAECRILNNEHAWFQNSDTTFDLNNGRYKAELFSFLTLSMPLGALTERFDGVRYGVREGDNLVYIYFKKTDSLLMAIGIDPHSMMITSSEGVIYQDEQKFSFKNLFSDYKKIDGYLIPHGLVNISLGMVVGASILIEAQINNEISANEFKPGELPRALIEQ